MTMYRLKLRPLYTRPRSARCPHKARVGLLFSAAAALALIALPASGVRAHGEAPMLMQLLFHPTDTDTMVIVASFGLLVTEDAGSSWDWVCPEAISGEYSLLGRGFLDAEGAVTLGSSTGVVRGEGLGCDWSRPSDELDGLYVVDLHNAPVDPSFALALSWEPDSVSSVYGTDNGGRTWGRRRARLPARLLSQGVRAAPSDPSRIYVTGVDPAGLRPYVFRSDGEGEPWIQTSIVSDAGEFAFPLLGVDTMNRDRLYLRAVSATYDRVAVSDDGAATFRDLAELDAPALAAGRPFGFAFGADGAVWVGNPTSGLLRVEGDAIRAVRADLAVTHVDAHGGDLWIGLDGRAGDDMAELVRAPMGDTDALEPVMRYEQLTGIRACSSPRVREMCDPLWDDLRRHVALLPPLEAGVGSLDSGLSPRDGGMARPDAGPDAGPDASISPMPPPPTGCGCHVATRSNTSGLGLLPVALLLLLRVRQRRT